MLLVVIIVALVATPIFLALTILILALAMMGEAFTVPFGGVYLVLAGLLGVVGGDGFEARRYIDANARKVLWGPVIWASHVISSIWGNLFDFLEGAGGGSPPSRPRGRSDRYRALPPGRR